MEHVICNNLWVIDANHPSGLQWRKVSITIREHEANNGKKDLYLFVKLQNKQDGRRAYDLFYGSFYYLINEILNDIFMDGLCYSQATSQQKFSGWWGLNLLSNAKLGRGMSQKTKNHSAISSVRIEECKKDIEKLTSHQWMNILAAAKKREKFQNLLRKKMEDAVC